MKIYVKLTASENQYLTYPCYGLLEIHEVGVTGSIMSASFRVEQDAPLHIDSTGKKQLSAPVEVRGAKFEYSQDTWRKGHRLVVELMERQRA